MISIPTKEKAVMRSQVQCHILSTPRGTIKDRAEVKVFRPNLNLIESDSKKNGLRIFWMSLSHYFHIRSFFYQIRYKVSETVTLKKNL